VTFVGHQHRQAPSDAQGKPTPTRIEQGDDPGPGRRSSAPRAGPPALPGSGEARDRDSVRQLSAAGSGVSPAWLGEGRGAAKETKIATGSPIGVSPVRPRPGADRWSRPLD
jgi:hypothetical protein